jgi:alkylhydroperoxidase family enzyme
MQMLIELAHAVTVAPWTLTRDHLARAHIAGLGDDDVLHAVLQSAYFNHLNRIADVVAVPLDYAVRHMPPAVDRSVPARVVAPHVLAGPFAIEPTRRAASWTALLAWRDYILDREIGEGRRRLPQTRRLVIATQVARLVGDSIDLVPPTDALDRLLVDLARQVALQPWAITDATLAPLREACLDDAQLFDVCATASTADTFARATVALRALAT